VWPTAAQHQKKPLASEPNDSGAENEAELLKGGGYFGGYIKPANQKVYRRDRRLVRNQNGKRKVLW
jgi:hypothetical protein